MRNSQRWHSAHIRAHRDLSATVREFEIRPEGGVLPWTVGGHIDVQVQVDGRAETRSYSLVGLPGGDAYRIAVKRAQPSRGGSAFLWSRETGDELPVGEPRNQFELGRTARDTLLVAGGIGITPLLGMAQTLAARGAKVAMCYAARSADELVFADTLRAALGDRLRLFRGDAGERIDIAREIAALSPGAQLLACGPIGLLESLCTAWAAAGRTGADLRFETFGNSGHFAAEPFWVELPRHGLRIEVPAERSLLDVLADAGVEVLADCRRGECGLCAMDVVRVEGQLDHRDVFFSAEQKHANQRLCACVSRVQGGGVVLDSAWREA
jgi:ferredoxin-NADP reductase